MKIKMGPEFKKLLELRRDSKEWDPDGLMPWTETKIVRVAGKKFKVKITLNPRERKSNV